jgi:predicted nucleic acid-binding protein
VQIVIADTGPVNYLILIGHIDILPALFSQVILPSAVGDELSDTNAPAIVRAWMSARPSWIEIMGMQGGAADSPIAGLGPGESAAILLASALHADLILMDERRGVVAAIERGLLVTGTMGLLARAAKQGLLDLASAFARLKNTNFRYRQETMDALLRDAESNQ